MKKSSLNIYVIDFFKFTFKLYPRYYLMLFFNSLCYTVLMIFNSYILAILLFAIKEDNFSTALTIGLGVALIDCILMVIVNYFKKEVRLKQVIMREKIDHMIAAKLMKIPYEYLENKSYLDMIKKAKYSINDENCIDNLFSSTAEIMQCLCTLVSLFFIIILFSPLLFFILLIGLILNSFVINYITKLTIQFNDNNIIINRKFDYYLDTLLNEKYGKDFRLYSVGKVLLKKYHHFINDMLSIVRKYENNIAFAKNGLDIIKYIELLLIYLIIIFIVMKNHLSIATFSLYVVASTNFSNTFATFFKQRMKFLANSKLIIPLMSLLAIKENDDKLLELNYFKSLEFRNVSFHYPDNDRMILKNINFKINRGDKISIVGLNGAGKTTIVKLICRLYHPTDGKILINGVSIDDYNEQSYLAMIATLFQDFKIFPFTIKDNIQTHNQLTDEVVNTIINKVGLNNKFVGDSLGLDTMCYRNFNQEGVEFSGGEAQKLAFGRVLATSSELVILDEPTSAYDPITEAKFYEDFANLLSDRTIIFISHRMSSSIFSDRVLLIDDGTVAAFDTHENLIKDKNSLYYELFMKQADNYKK